VDDKILETPYKVILILKVVKPLLRLLALAQTLLIAVWTETEVTRFPLTD